MVTPDDCRAPGFKDYYVTTDGRVWSALSNRYLKPKRIDSGHLFVCLRRYGVRCNRYIHRLVLEAFVGPRPDGMECCHNNGNPADNRIENLRWDTHSNNMKDAVKHGTCPLAGSRIQRAQGEQNGRATLTAVQVRAVRDAREKYRVSQYVLARLTGVRRETIGKILRGERWGHLHN